MPHESKLLVRRLKRHELEMRGRQPECRLRSDVPRRLWRNCPTGCAAIRSHPSPEKTPSPNPPGNFALAKLHFSPRGEGQDEGGLPHVQPDSISDGGIIEGASVVHAAGEPRKRLAIRSPRHFGSWEAALDLPCKSAHCYALTATLAFYFVTGVNAHPLAMKPHHPSRRAFGRPQDEAGAYKTAASW
jgi:hypothetical protein